MSTPHVSKKMKSVHTGITPSNPYNTQSQSIVSTSQKADTISNIATVLPMSGNKKMNGIAQGKDDSKCKKHNMIVNKQPCGNTPLKSIKRVNKGKRQRTTMTQQYKIDVHKNNKEETSTKDYSFSFSCSPSYSSQDDKDYDSLMYVIGGNTKVQCETDKFCDICGFRIGQDGPKMPSRRDRMFDII
jgi:hypothetical protein